MDQISLDNMTPISPTSQESRYEILRKTALFKDLSDRELDLLATRLTEIHVPRGHQLLIQGEYARHVFWLISGSVHVIAHGEIVAQVDTVQCFGEMSCLIPDSKCSATVNAVEDCKILSIDQAPFLEVVSAIPKLWQSLFTQSSKRLNISNNRLSEVLAHVTQGFLKLDKSARITQEYSARCLRYFDETNLAGMSFIDLLKMNDPREIESWLEIYGMLFTDSLVPFEDLTALLTTEYQLEKNGLITDLLLTYHPSINVQGEIDAIDVGIEDVTALRKLELVNAVLHYEQATLGRIYGDPESFISMLELMTIALADCQDLCNVSAAFEVTGFALQIEVTMRSVHRLKGLAGVFGLESIARCCDEMAIQIREIEHQVGQHSAKDVPILLAGFIEDFSRVLMQLENESTQAHALQNKIGDTRLKRLKGVVFSQEVFASLKEHLKSAEISQALAIIESAEARDAIHLFNNWNVKVELLARTLSKQARFELTGTGGAIQKDLFTDLSSMLVHIINNALDHGIEPPKEREDNGKSREGLVKAHVSISGNTLMLDITDDGRGIDIDRLLDLAKNKTSIDQAEVSAHKQNGEVWRILLLPGFTMSSEVTRFSGYGVGLDSLNQMVLAKGGCLKIESLLDEGTTIRIAIPLSVSKEMAYVF
jgi:CRP-like cAMP-binding protein/signal transduction histidine kinase